MRVVVEIPIGSSIKYEYHQGTLMVDRVLSMPYPGNYGYIEDTLALDGDELDVILLVPYGLQIGCRVQCRAVGVLCMEDEEGEDHKLLAVPEADPASAAVRDIGDVPAERIQEIRHFFTEYKKNDPTRWSRVGAVHGAARAREILDEARERFRS